MAIAFGLSKGQGPSLVGLRNFSKVERLVNRTLARIPPEDTEAAANDRFGKASPLEWRDGSAGGYGINYGTVSISFPDAAGEEGEEEEKKIFRYRKVSHSVTKKRIYNESDHSQYVDVEYDVEVTFVDQKGDLHIFDFGSGG